MLDFGTGEGRGSSPEEQPMSTLLTMLTIVLLILVVEVGVSLLTGRL